MTNDGNPALLFNHTYDLEGRQISVSGATAPTPPYRQQVLADAPAGYWRLGEAAGNDVAADASGNGLNGSYRNPNVVRGDPGALEAAAATAKASSGASVP